MEKQLIPPDMKFDPNSNPPCFSNPEEQVSIERNARVRLKIVGTRVDATEIVSCFPARSSYLERVDKLNSL